MRKTVKLTARALAAQQNQKLRKGPVFSYFEGASLGGLVVVMDRLPLVRRVPLHIPVVHRVQIPPPGHLPRGRKKILGGTKDEKAVKLTARALAAQQKK